MGETAEHLTFC